MPDLSKNKPKLKRFKNSTGSVKTSDVKLPKLSIKARVIESTSRENCLSCRKFRTCEDENKKFNYVCGRYKPKQIIDFENLDLESDKTPIAEVKKKKVKTLSKLHENQSRELMGIGKSPAIIKSRYTDIQSADFDISKLVESINKTGYGMPADLTVDDRDLPLAKNFAEFMYSPVFLDYKPFAKQIEIGININNDYCYYCSDVTYAQNIPTDATFEEICDHVVLLEHGVCPKCKHTRADMWKNYGNKGAKRYNELCGLAGQRGGKSVVTAMLCSYLAHRFLKIPNPNRLFNQLPSNVFHITFTAVTYKQARETLFVPMYKMVSESPWFKNYHALLDHYGKKAGKELYTFKDTIFEYKNKSLIAYSAAPDKKNLRGRNRIGGAIDELGWFFSKTQQAIKLDPDEIYAAMENSFYSTRSAVWTLYDMGYYDIPSPMFCNISSPSSSRDKMMRLLRESKDSATVYSFHYSSFQMRPDLNPIVFDQKKKSDPVGYRRDIMALPPDSTSAFINDRKTVLACIDKEHSNMAKLEQTTVVSSKNISYSSGIVHPVKQIESVNRIMAIDAGYNYNSFACCVMHLEEFGDEYIPKVDALFEVIPSEDAPCSYTDIYTNVLSEIVNQFNIKFVGADRWNSIFLLQKFEEDHEISYTQHSVKYQDMLEFREAVQSQHIILPKGEIKIADAFALSVGGYPECFKGRPVSHAMIQMLTVEDIMNKRVEKGRGYTDDLFRAMVLCHCLVIDKEVQEMFLADAPPPRPNRQIGVVGSYGGGASSGGRSGGSSSTSRIVSASYVGSAGGGSQGGSSGGNAGVFSRGR